MNKITNWKNFEQAEKKMIWAEFFMRILVMISIIGCVIMACYALYWFVMAALKAPILIAYAVGILVGIFYLAYAWGEAKLRSEKRLVELHRAEGFQEEAEEWETKLHKYMETPENETEEEYKTRQNNISHAKTSHEYYLGRRDEAMHEYRKLGGKKYE
jgi:hypothetical protein